MKYQLKPILPENSQEEIEKAVYVIARCLSLAAFSIDDNVYNQLLEKEKEMFTLGAFDMSELRQE